MTEDLVEISVAVDGEVAEAVSELFERYGGGAVVETRLRERPEDGPDLATPLVWVRTYLPADDPEARMRVEVGLWHLAQIHPLPEPEIKLLAQADWADAWKAHFTPQRIGHRFWVLPSWLDGESSIPAQTDRQGLDDDDALVIRLDPGMAFGTGLHPTTQLCLAALEEVVSPGLSLLDVGTGSGILAIGAGLLGASPLVGVDTDAGAVTIAVENAGLNGLTLVGHHGPLDTLPPDTLPPNVAGVKAGRFDVVVANILAEIISALAPELASRLKPDGVLITSGILDTQAAATVHALEAAGLHVERQDLSGDWVALWARPGALTPGPSPNAGRGEEKDHILAALD